MSTWEDAKRAAQSTYINAGNGFQDRNGFGQAYQQFLLTGQISPSLGLSDIHHQIAEEPYQPTETDWQEYAHYRDAWEKENPDPRLTGPDPDAPELG
ncbi:hypothetical protein EPA93_03950 [Ktedonosporobacter rubrisoli]|uniref:Uncharacterized protein n=1 Tax=Ktedonosporobacter rubrisoli TaxID=2509675 RepID=A0A4P6JJS4_KTERU|nr:hypothetical protein [Ktedonosporobacter rubrisoli]QBD75190.1 hypothetical protein EPA93_03950 [Ktedonosporobacter rubrisoli]